MNEIDAAERGGSGGDIGEDLEPALELLPRQLCGALGHRRRLDDGPAQRRADCGRDAQVMKAAAAAEVEHVQRPLGQFGRRNADRQDRIDRLFRRHLQAVDRHRRGHVGDDFGELAVIIALSAGGERRCKIRENVGNDGQSLPLWRSSPVALCARGRFIAKPAPCPPFPRPAAGRGFHARDRRRYLCAIGPSIAASCGLRGRRAGIVFRCRIMAAKTRFRGSFTALVTPFKNGSVDEKAFRDLVDWQIAEGTNGLVPVGTTGESPTLSHDEHNKVVEWCVEQARGRVPVMAGAGSNSTKEAIDLAKHAEKAGADAVLVVTPYYNKPTQEGLYQHFKAINDAIGIPILIYNIPPRSVIDMSVDTMKRLYELKNIAGVKDATANMTRVTQQRAAHGRGLQSAVRRRHHRARLHGPWRPWLHFGDLERGAAAVLGVPGGVPEGRLRFRFKASGQARAVAHQSLCRNLAGADQICAVADRKVRAQCAPAHGARVREGAGRRARGHGACRPDQLTGRCANFRSRRGRLTSRASLRRQRDCRRSIEAGDGYRCLKNSRNSRCAAMSSISPSA